MIRPADTWPTISRLVWETKYRWADETGIDETWWRVARAVAAIETADRDRWSERFHELLRGFSFLPGGRIIAGAGTDRHVTLFNCFVMGRIEDTLEGIFDGLKQGAMTTVFRPNPIRGEILSAAIPLEPSHCRDLEREAD